MQCRRTFIFRSQVSLVSIATMILFGVTLAAAQTENTLYTFTGGPDGSWPKAGVVFGPDGNLYGATQYGGAYTFGTVYKVTHSGGTWTETVIYDFTDVNDGAGPIGSVAFDAAGNIYGTTAFGNRNGTVFELTHAPDGTWLASQLYSFTGGNDGQEPLTGVVIDKAGNLYGTATLGGTSGNGVLYELSPNGDGTWTQKVIYAFGSVPGGLIVPTSALLIDASGNLYGAAETESTAGSIYELSPNSDGSWTEQILYSFTGKGDGGEPEVLTFDGPNTLFGGAGGGGKTSTTCLPFGCGTIFRLTRSTGGSWHFNLLYQFDGTTGSDPNGIAADPSGNLFGTALNGGPSSGVAFELKRNSTGQGWTYSSLYDFGADGGGIEPMGLVVKQDHVFGTSLSTTTCYLCGTVWEITP
jgi:uncharacterized repeat protein (TIGR03803 family)